MAASYLLAVTVPRAVCTSHPPSGLISIPITCSAVKNGTLPPPAAHLSVLHDLGASLPGADGHGLGQAVRVDVSLAGRQQPPVDLGKMLLLKVLPILHLLLLLLLLPAHPVHVEYGHELGHLVLGEQLHGALLVRLGGEGEHWCWRWD